MSWLDSLTEGSHVVLDPGGGFALRLFKVDRLTKTQIIIGHSRFRRSDGREVGSYSYGYRQLLEPKPALIERIRRDMLVGFIKRSEARMERLPLEILDNFARQLKSVTPPV